VEKAKPGAARQIGTAIDANPAGCFPKRSM